MSVLITVVESMLNAQTESERSVAEHRVIETLTFSNFQEIVSMLNNFLDENLLILPPWTRNLSYRLACFLAPNDSEIRRIAAADLLVVGPDWDDEAGRLFKEAEEIEAKAQ